MKRITTIFLGITAMATCTLNAQVNFTTSTETYASLTGATQLLKDSVWDDFQYGNIPSDMVIALGFKIKYNGTEHDTLYLYDANILGNDNSVVFGTGMDMIDRGFGTSSSKSPIYIKREGSTPNRIVKIEFKNAGFFDELNDNSTLDDSLTAQYWFYENGNKFEYHAGPSSIAGKYPTYLNFITVGVLGNGNSPSAVLEGPNSNPTLVTDLNTTAGLDEYPLSGRVYTFAMDPNYTHTKGAISNTGNVYYANQILYSRNADINNFRIFSIDGKQVLTGKFSDSKADLEQLPVGTYVAIFKGGALKFVKE